MLAKAKLKYERISARKVRLVCDLIRGKTVEQASFILDNVNKRASGPLHKVLDSAVANANYNRQEKILLKDLVISAISANEGPMFKRYRAATMGRAATIRHRTAHIVIELDRSASSEPKKEEVDVKEQSLEVGKKKKIKNVNMKRKAKAKV